MGFTSNAIGELGRINGPRCCKRDAMIAFKHGIEYVNQHYDVHLEYEEQTCEFRQRTSSVSRADVRFINDAGGHSNGTEKDRV